MTVSPTRRSEDENSVSSTIVLLDSSVSLVVSDQSINSNEGTQNPEPEHGRLVSAARRMSLGSLKLKQEHHDQERRPICDDKHHENRSSAILDHEQDEGTQFCGASSKTNKVFNLFVVVIPSVLVAWDAIAILFPPEARKMNIIGRYLLWTDGELILNEKGQYTLCPRSSICSVGSFQIWMIASARLTAFVSYVFMTLTFASKMNFLTRFLAKTYMRKIVPFEALHHLYTYVSKIYAGLIFVHVLTHYFRYMARKDIGQLGSTVHLSGVFGAFAMVIMIFGMASKKVKYQLKFCTFERRINLHWIGMVILFIMLCYHHPRARIVTLVVFGLWALDYLYGVFFATYNLEVVELLPLSNQAGVQMLWRNPESFNPKSGEYVKIQLPWLSHGEHEWHPFSLYLRESTEQVLSHVYSNRQPCNDKFSGGSCIDEEGMVTKPLEVYIKDLLDTSIKCADTTGTLNESNLKSSFSSRFVEEAREDLQKKYKTTQIFIAPCGDWTNRLMNELANQKQLRACWVRGPYKRPYSVAQDFSHLVLTATGIGITPALGVLGQYPGFSRTKIFIWSTRDPDLLKFFVPLLIKDSHLSIIYYTNKDRKLSPREVFELSSHDNIYIQQSRPGSLTKTIETVVLGFENNLNNLSEVSIKNLNLIYRKSWCLFYCGGSKRLRNDLKVFANCNGVKFESELFNW